MAYCSHVLHSSLNPSTFGLAIRAIQDREPATLNTLAKGAICDMLSAKTIEDEQGHQMQVPPTIVLLESKPINDTRLYCFLVLYLIKLLKHFRPRYSGILFLSNKICVKYSPLKNLLEASTMQFIC